MERSRLHPAWVMAALCFGLIAAWLHPGEGTGVPGALDAKLLDLRFQWRGAQGPPASVAIVAIDDRTIAELGRFPVPRREIATAIDQALNAGAAAVAVDLLFLEREAPNDGNVLSAGDRRLLETLRATDRVVLAAAGADSNIAAANSANDWIVSANTFGVVSRNPAIDGEHGVKQVLLPPIEPFARAASVALVNVATEADGKLRRIQLALEIGDGMFMPTLPLEAMRRKLEIDRVDMRLSAGVAVELGHLKLPTDYASAIVIDYLGPVGTVPTFSLIDVAQARVPAEALSGRVVFVGATALGFGDIFETPFGRLPGVEVLANVAENIGAERILRRDYLSWGLDMAFCALFAGLAFFAANSAPMPISTALYAAVWLLAGGCVQYLFQRHQFWLDASSLATTLAVVGVSVYGARLPLLRRMATQLRQQRDNLAAYQSPLLKEWLAGPNAPDFAGRMQIATILFVDLSGFTRRAQSLGPTATSAFLRDLHRLFERAALAHGGVIEQFAGDGAMLIFGLPEAKPLDAPEALLCARDMLADITRWSSALVADGGQPMALRAGLHSGPVMIARLGGEKQAHVTASGDTVNVASRLLDIAKREAAPIAATADFAAAVMLAGRPDLLHGHRLLRNEVLRGRAGPIDLMILD